MNKYVFCALLLGGILLLAAIGTKWYIHTNEEGNYLSEDETIIVTSFYPMYVIAANLTEGMEGDIRIENLSEPQGGCLHNYQLTTGDMQLLSHADVFIVNGGGAESFLADVLKAYPELRIIEACHMLEEHTQETADEDEHDHDHDHEGHHHSALAHAWMCPKDYKVQIAFVGEMLVELFPEYEGKIHENTERYQKEIDDILMEMEQLQTEADEAHVVLLHEGFEPLCLALGFEVLEILNLDDESQISSGQLADVVEEMDAHPGTIILAEEGYGNAIAETLQRETGATIVYINPLTRGELQKEGYVQGMLDNILKLKEALLP